MKNKLAQVIFLLAVGALGFSFAWLSCLLGLGFFSSPNSAAAEFQGGLSLIFGFCAMGCLVVIGEIFDALLDRKRNSGSPGESYRGR